MIAASIRSRLSSVLRPLGELDRVERAVLLGVAILHAVGIGWGLPALDGWDVDGVAPRDFLAGVVKTFTPGEYFTYPPFHLALLTLLTLPITLVVLARAPSLAPPDVVAAFVTMPVMTAFALVARVVNLLMSLGIVWAVGEIASTLFRARRARAWAMAVSGVEVACSYYAHATNLDLAALFWAMLAFLELVRAVDETEPKKLRRVAVFAAFAIASKDQAYALFALSLPLALILVRDRRTILEAARAGVTVVGLVLLLDGAFFNPTGFAARLRFLTGPASQDFAQHPRDLAGRFSTFVDALTFLPNHYPFVLVPVFAIGFVLARPRLRLVPLFGVLSFTLAFNCIARRVEERFMMPQMQLLAIYAGGIAVVVERAGRFAAVARLAGAACVVAGLRLSLAMVATMLGDARYDAEAFLREHAAGALTEVYGPNVYLPRFSASARVQRVDPRPTRGRNPMPGIVEVQGRLSDVELRAPRFIVVGSGFAWRYLQSAAEYHDGKVMPPVQQAGLADHDTASYIQALWAGRAGYRLVRRSHYAGWPLLPPRPLHASLATDVFIFERIEP